MEQRRPWARRLGGAVLSSVEPAPARFVLPQLYYPWLWEARFRLTIIPVALGVVAPFSSSLYELRPRLVMIAGMAICIAALVVLTTTLTGAPPHSSRREDRTGSVRHCGSESRSREGLASSLSAAHRRHD